MYPVRNLIFKRLDYKGCQTRLCPLISYDKGAHQTARKQLSCVKNMTIKYRLEAKRVVPGADDAHPSR